MSSFSGRTFILFRFRLNSYTFIVAAALRSVILQYAGAPTATRVSSLFPFVSLEMSLFRSIFVPLPFSLCMESTSYVFSFRVVFIYLVTTGWIFNLSLCENLIKKNQIATGVCHALLMRDHYYSVVQGFHHNMRYVFCVRSYKLALLTEK